MAAYGTVFTKPGEFYEFECPVCKELMDVKRNANGPTGFAEAMSKHSHLHDTFTCRFKDEMWHKQVYKLQGDAQDSPSKKLADIMLGEADEIIKNRLHTKNVSMF